MCRVGCRSCPLRTAVKRARAMSGAVLGSFEAWLLMRGMRTLHVRLKRQSDTAMVRFGFCTRTGPLLKKQRKTYIRERSMSRIRRRRWLTFFPLMLTNA